MFFHLLMSISLSVCRLSIMSVSLLINAGAGSSVYPAAYFFFEKLRIQQGRPKTAHRVRLEAELPEGFPLETPSKVFYIVRRT